MALPKKVIELKRENIFNDNLNKDFSNIKLKQQEKLYKKHEHMMTVGVLVWALVCALITINSSINVNTKQHELQTIQEKTLNYKNKNQTLKQEISDKLSFSNVNDLAHQLGLNTTNNNVKDIK